MMRPCGVCAALVPETGCPHWRPEQTRVALRRAQQRRRSSEKVARDRAKQDVAEFRRAMGQ